MELSSSKTMKETYKLYSLWSMIACLFIFLLLNQTDLYDSLSAAKTRLFEYKVNSAFSLNDKLQPEEAKKECNIFEGKWVYKPRKVKDGVGEHIGYNVTDCPFIEEKWNCRRNERPDFDYERWTWEANDCVIPLFNGRDMLERLRNKRMILVGDSLNRNQWESLACLLYTSIPPSSAIVDAKGSLYKVLKAKDYNFTLEFHWSPFIVEQDNKHKSGKTVLKLDVLPAMSKKWKGADVMLFNSGHWWTHLGKFRSWDIFQYKDELIEDMPIEKAYKIGMQTWSNWVSNNVDSNKTKVFFRSISPEHQTQWCYNTTEPNQDDFYTTKYPNSLVETIRGIIESEKTRVKVEYMNITTLSQYRRDAHPSVYRGMKWKDGLEKINIRSVADCSHWCLPGLPDTWNRLLYVSLFFRNFF